MKYTNEEITERRKADLPDAKDVQTFRAYARGQHPDQLSTAQNKLLGARTEHRMVDNVVDLILNTTASRLKLTTWDILGEAPVSIADGSPISDSDANAARSYLQGLWLRNRVQRLQYEVHYAALRDGNSAVSMTYQGGRVRLWREPWWDGGTGVYIAYSDDGGYEFAVKEWNQRERNGTVIKRRTVYEAGLISRYYQDGDGWKDYEGDGPAAIAVLRGAADDARPMPIPFVHFPNGTAITEDDYGDSDIANLLALQDDLNATQRDISAAAMMTAFQRLFFAGVSAQTKITIAPGEAMGDEDPSASVTVIQPGDMAALIDVHSHKRQSLSTNSRTPMHAISGQWPSGAALLRADMPQIDKVEALGDVEGPQWTMVAHRAMELANHFGRLNLNEDAPITSVFAPSERIDELTSLEIKQAEATYWETIARLPREAMIQAGVDSETADLLVQQRAEMNVLIADAGF